MSASFGKKQGAGRHEAGGNPFSGLDAAHLPTQKEKEAARRAESAPKTRPRPEEEPSFAELMAGSVAVLKREERKKGGSALRTLGEGTPLEGLKKKKEAAGAPSVPPAPAAAPRQPEPREDEADLFLRAVGTVAPLDRRGRDVPAPLEKKTAPDGKSDLALLQDVMAGKIEFSLELTGEFIQAHVRGLDPAIMGKLRAGSYHPEAHLDLHGLNAVQAYERLTGFLRQSYYKGFRCVLIIPGRGKNSPDGIGVLREKMQLWLTRDPFKRVVLAFCTAQPAQGGAGALTVLLRKYRKNSGKIQWDRLPADPDLYD